MTRANVRQKKLIVDLLTAAFQDNQSVNFIVPQDKRRLKRISALMDYSFEMCHHFGDVWLTEQQDACALILYSHLKKFSMLACWLTVKLILQAIGIGGIFKALKHEGRIKQLQPQLPATYLWFIGVEPTAQHAGRGSQLLKEIIALADKKNLPVYLETSTLSNLPWYQKYGFAAYGQADFGFTLYFLRRNLDKY